MIGKKLNWVPNLFTLGNLTLGFFAIVFALHGNGQENLQLAGSLIFLAALCDGVDGAAARLLKAGSELGAQLDSLADLVTFGVAPAALAYVMVLRELDHVAFWPPGLPLGMALAAIYPACAAYRLARFNVVHVTDSFAGLPSPIAGVIMALLVFVHPALFELPLFLPALVFLVMAFLMVSTIRYSKPQVTFLRRFSRGRLIIVLSFMVLALVVLYLRYGPSHAAALLLTIALVYVLTGLVAFVIHVIQVYRV